MLDVTAAGRRDPSKYVHYDNTIHHGCVSPVYHLLGDCNGSCYYDDDRQLKLLRSIFYVKANFLCLYPNVAPQERLIFSHV